MLIYTRRPRRMFSNTSFDPAAAFREIARTLRPGGAHVFTTPLHMRRFTLSKCFCRKPAYSHGRKVNRRFHSRRSWVIDAVPCSLPRAKQRSTRMSKWFPSVQRVGQQGAAQRAESLLFLWCCSKTLAYLRPCCRPRDSMIMRGKLKISRWFALAHRTK